MTGRPWSDPERARLRELRAAGVPWPECAADLGRTVPACKQELYRLAAPARRASGRLAPRAAVLARELGLSVGVWPNGREGVFWAVRDAGSGLELGTYVPATRWYRAGSVRGRSADPAEVLGVFAAEADRRCPGRVARAGDGRAAG